MTTDTPEKTLSVPEAGRRYFDLGRQAAYGAAKRGDIPTIRIGRLIRVPVRALEKMLGWRAMTDDDDEYLTGMYELLEAVEAVIQAADPAKREALADTLDAYTGGFGDEFHWAIGPQSPTLLHHLMSAIEAECRPEAQSKPRAVIRLIDRKPEGNA